MDTSRLNLIICLERFQRPAVFRYTYALVQIFNPNFWSTFNMWHSQVASDVNRWLVGYIEGPKVVQNITQAVEEHTCTVGTWLRLTSLRVFG